MGKLRKQGILLAGLCLFCVLIVWQSGTTAGELLKNGVDFDGLIIAITAPEGDSTGETLSVWLGKLQDVKSYCTFLSMGQAEAEKALQQGEISAILALPADFIDGVQTDVNPDVTLIVSAERPLEALLANWVGTSAADLLSTFQQGIYAVLDAYDQMHPSNLSRNEVVFDINLRYINWSLSREECFNTITVSATDGLPLSLHYGLSLSAYFLLALSQALSKLYTPKTLLPYKRLRCTGHGAGPCFAASIAAGVLFFFPVSFILVLAGKLTPDAILLPSLLWALLGSLWSSVLCLSVRDSAVRGAISFLLSLLFLLLSGGLLPPVMLAPPVRLIGAYTPVAAMRSIATTSDTIGYTVLFGWIIVTTLAGFWLYRKQMYGG